MMTTKERSRFIARHPFRFFPPFGAGQPTYFRTVDEALDFGREQAIPLAEIIQDTGSSYVDIAKYDECGALVRS
jgi:hypothetical protein